MALQERRRERRRERGTTPAGRRSTAPDAPRGVGPSLALLGEVVVVGVVVALAVVPLVTALPALAAGALHLRAHVRGEADGLRALAGRLRAAGRRPWGASLIVGGLVLVLLVDLSVVLLSPSRPPAPALAALAAGAAVLVVLLRAAATWSPGEAWGPLVRRAADRSLDDLAGSLLVLLSLGLAALLVWMLLPLALVVGGLVVLAAVAVEMRPAAGGRPATDDA
ncbi:hypothetical protein WDZ16_05855 [Pseudokineococcus marinus]